ncbi:32028_t:CDS:2 [Racocetra persica]|uniref:32028_t:CDS:1 n=1 Tax=Racocetra persica TaxID=160502 RepID=A0ACA9LIQ1_9GLOM|nr:32028_t:CDS:2 [Racocetra persica]
MPPRKVKSTAKNDSTAPSAVRSTRKSTTSKDIKNEDISNLIEEDQLTVNSDRRHEELIKSYSPEDNADLTNEANAEPQGALPKKRAKSITSPKNPRIKRPRREDAIEIAATSESSTHKQTGAPNDQARDNSERKTDNSDFVEISTASDKVQPIEDISMEDASSGEKSSLNSSSHGAQGSSHTIRSESNDDTVPVIQKRWETIKERLFEIPKLPKPPYKDYQEKIVIRRPWMKKKDIDYLQKLLTDPNSPLGHKYIKHIINHNVYSEFTDEQKTRLMNLLPRSDLVPIASDAGEPIDTPRIERERQAQGLKLYEAGVSGTITEIDPQKVVPRFDFWLSDAFKDSRWWFQLSVKYGYFTKLGVDSQWTNLEKFKTEVPDIWKPLGLLGKFYDNREKACIPKIDKSIKGIPNAKIRNITDRKPKLGLYP